MEANEMTKMVPLVASPVKGPLFNFMELDVDMVPATPAACSLQHLAQCVTKPTWLADADRLSRARPRLPPPRLTCPRAGLTRSICLLPYCLACAVCWTCSGLVARR